MKRLGFLLGVFGFLSGAVVAVQDINDINWPPFVACIVVGAIGVIMRRRATQAQSGQEHVVHGNLATLESSIGNVVQKLGQLKSQKDSINVYDIHLKIDELFPDDLSAFEDAREAMVNAYSLKAYADVMNHFASAERYLNRVWSASADGYIDEAHTYLERSYDQFVQTQKRLTALKSA